LEIQKKDLPLHPLPIRYDIETDRRKGSEKSAKRFGGLKKMTYLCTAFRREKMAVGAERVALARPGKTKEKVLYSDISNNVL